MERQGRQGDSNRGKAKQSYIVKLATATSDWSWILAGPSKKLYYVHSKTLLLADERKT